MQDLTAGLPLTFNIHLDDGPFRDTDEGNALLWNRLQAWDREGSLIACAHHRDDTVRNSLPDHACVTLLAVPPFATLL